MSKIRAQRRTLKELRGTGEITPSQYRHFYRKAKGGSYRSISHLKSNIGADGIEVGGED